MWRSLVQRVATSWIKPQAKQSSHLGVTKEIFPTSHTESQKCLLFGTTDDQDNGSCGDKKKKTCHERARDKEGIYPGCYLETFGWVGAMVVLGKNLHDLFWKYQPPQVCKRDGTVVENRKHPICSHIFRIFSPRVSAMHSVDQNRQLVTQASAVPDGETYVINNTPSENASPSEKVTESIKTLCEDIRNVTLEYFGDLENVSGIIAKQHEDRFQHFKSGAKLHNTKAQFNLGVCYETGHGTEVDYNKAAELYMLASKAGHSMATYNLGVYYLEGKGGLSVDVTKAVQLIEQAAKQGVSPAQTYIGIHYMEKQNWEQALYFLKKAADQDPEAQYYLALCYENGWGVQLNCKRAIHLYHESAAAGHTESLYALGLSYEKNAHGIEKNLELAMTFHQMATDGGHDTAAKRVKYLKDIQIAQQQPQYNQGTVLKRYKRIQSFSSVPDFHSYEKKPFSAPVYQKTISHYLDIIFSNDWIKPSPKVDFFLGEQPELASLSIQAQSPTPTVIKAI